MEQFTQIDMPSSQKIKLLEELHWTQDLNNQQLNKLSEFFSVYRAPAGSKILTEGMSNQLLCLLAEGQVAVIKEDSTGTNKELQVLGVGKLFGEVSFFDKSPCSASIYAKNDALLLIMEKKSFIALSTEVPSIALQIVLGIMSDICKRLRLTTGKLIDLL